MPEDLTGGWPLMPKGESNEAPVAGGGTEAAAALGGATEAEAAEEGGRMRVGGAPSFMKTSKGEDLEADNEAPLGLATSEEGDLDAVAAEEGRGLRCS